MFSIKHKENNKNQTIINHHHLFEKIKDKRFDHQINLQNSIRSNLKNSETKKYLLVDS
jgi:ADP-heptose:LPS heptosyltransferase